MLKILKSIIFNLSTKNIKFLQKDFFLQGSFFAQGFIFLHGVIYFCAPLYEAIAIFIGKVAHLVFGYKTDNNLKYNLKLTCNYDQRSDSSNYCFECALYDSY